MHGSRLSASAHRPWQAPPLVARLARLRYPREGRRQSLRHRRRGSLFSSQLFPKWWHLPALARAERRTPRSLSQCILETAESILDFAGGLLDLTIRLELLVAQRLADRLLGRALDLFRGSLDPILIHDCILPSRDRVSARQPQYIGRHRCGSLGKYLNRTCARVVAWRRKTRRHARRSPSS